MTGAGTVVDVNEYLEITGRAVLDTSAEAIEGVKRDAAGDRGPRNPSTSPSASAGSASDFTDGLKREVRGDAGARNPSKSSLCAVTGKPSNAT
jgi:hypothetical protein